MNKWSIKQTNENNEKSSNYGFLEKEANKENIKTFAIIVLAFLLIISIFTGHTQKNDDSQNQISELKSKLEDTTNKMVDKQKEIIDLQNSNKILQDEKTKLESEITNLQDEKTKLENENQELNSKIEELKNTSSVKTTSNITSNNTTKNNSSTNSNSSTSTSKTTSTSSSTNLSTKNTTSSYVLNTNSKKFHIPSCSSVSKMNDSNKKYVNESRDEIISKGYVPCKVCNP